MVNFRRVVTALAVLVLFTGLAFAQENCSAQGTVSTPLRSEGFTEQTGDIIITCNGGFPLAPNSLVPLVNITVYYNAAVTSRLLGVAGPSGQTPSEALLLVDEPTTGTGGTIGPGGPAVNQVSYGSTLPLIPCLTPLTGCAQTVGPNNTGFATAVAVSGGPAPNVYQGVSIGNSVTFYGVPVLPPSTVGSRIYRITNVRVNANALPGPFTIQAFIAVSGSASLPISNAQPFVGIATTSLIGSISGAKTIKQCLPRTTANGAVTSLTFQENFGTAFKTRVAAQTNDAYAGQLGVLPQAPAVHNQSTPGAIYNSESNFVYAGAFSDGSHTAGLADFGTRLKATFNGIPSGVQVFVSVNNTGTPNPGGTIGGMNANVNATTGPYIGVAQLVSSETASDGAATTALSTFPSVAGSAGIAEVPIVAQTGSAVWEVVNTNPNTSEGFTFDVFIAYAPGTNNPLPGTATVTLSYAPTATSGVASATANIPRFVASNVATGSILSIGVCRTVLLYPYVTNQAGFDTGLTVANTSHDPFTTGSNTTVGQQGNCVFTFYGGTTAAPTVPPPPYDIAKSEPVTYANGIAAGTVWANTVGTIAPSFQGYAFAVCNFQFAHGFAFISDVGARNLAMGYLALVIPDVPLRDPSSGSLPNTGNGEQDSH